MTPALSLVNAGNDYEKLGLATAVLLAMTGAHAYQFEVQGQSEYVDTTANDKNFTGDVAGTFYLKMLIPLRVL